MEIHDRYWQKLEDIDNKLDALHVEVVGKYVTKKEFGWAIGTLVAIAAVVIPMVV